MTEIKIPVVYPDPDIDVIGINVMITDAIQRVPKEQRSNVNNVITGGILYLQGPEEEIKNLLLVIKKVMRDYATWLTKQADMIVITENTQKM